MKLRLGLLGLKDDQIKNLTQNRRLLRLKQTSEVHNHVQYPQYGGQSAAAAIAR